MNLAIPESIIITILLHEMWYLHQFTVQEKACGIAYSEGVSFSDNARKVHLKDLYFCQNEKFTYECNLEIFFKCADTLPSAMCTLLQATKKKFQGGTEYFCQKRRQ